MFSFTHNQLILLSVFLTNPERDFYFSELGRMIGKAPGVFQKSINALEDKGIIKSTRRGNQRLFTLNTEFHLLKEIDSIVKKSTGIERALQDYFLSKPSIHTALVFGSYASGKMRMNSDIDVMIVGDQVNEDDFLALVTDLEIKTGREINYSIYSDREFKKKIKADPFIKEVLKNKYILLKGMI